jgi:hypothetical protein
MALLGLGVLAVATVADRYLSLASEVWAVILVGLGIGVAWLVSFNMFAHFGFAARNNAIGITITGVIIAGAAYFWRDILGFFRGLSRKHTDQAATMEKSEHLRRVA